MIVQAKRLSKSVKGPDNKLIEILTAIDLTLFKGEFLSVLGPSGSGKTTLLQILGLMDTPTSGQINLFNKDIISLTNEQKASMRANNIGFIFQKALLITDLTLEQNIKFVSKLSNKDINQERIDLILNKIGLYNKRFNYPRMLSAGEAQRGALARAIINEPQIIIADEPTANLDKANKLKILDLFKSFNEENNVSIILASHDEIVLNYCSKCLHLEDGRINQ